MDTVLVALGLAVILVVGLCGAMWWLVASSLRERRQRHQRQAAADFARGSSARVRFRGDDEHPAHVFRGQGEVVTVAELLEAAREHDDGVRLKWRERDEARTRVTASGSLNAQCWPGVRPYAQGQLPTVVLPKPSEGEASSDDEGTHGAR